MSHDTPYEQMLDSGRKNLPEAVFQKERFEIPKAMGHVQGNRTIISNFNQIANVLQRNTEHLLKYILKELATPGDVKPKGLLLGTKISATRFNEKVRQYANEYVLCSDCGKPDTQLIKEGGFLFLKCTACGSKHPIKRRM